ncbi:MAG: hypothetical protein IPK00_26955 [Deltaproteobacteria bacterium]|nr:hypothetical protein [Deltaproteobacteria bacterium]
MIERLRATPRQYLLYVCFYQAWGLVSNAIGQAIELARFAHAWQTFTCYVLYLVLASLLVREKSLAEQYIYKLLILAPLKLLSYSLGSSIAYDGNLFDRILGPRNFTLAMTVMFAIIPPVGNSVVAFLDRTLPGAPRDRDPR